MGRPLRFVPPRTVVEVTVRTVQRRLLLRPSEELNEIVLGVLGRALQRYDVELVAFVVLSNHVHYLLSPADTRELAGFMRYVNGNLSREVGRLHDWSGPLWDRRYRSIVVADDESQVTRLRYLLQQGCKEGLVARPADWPGVHTVSALVEGTALVGTWTDRSAMYEARRAGDAVDQDEFTVEYEVPLTPLPCWADLPVEEYRRRCEELVADIERETAQRNADLGRRPAGVAFVLRQDPHGKPRSSNWSPAPMVHAASKTTREAFMSAYRRFANQFRAAAAQLRLGRIPNSGFPANSFPPGMPFVLTT